MLSDVSSVDQLLNQPAPSAIDQQATKIQALARGHMERKRSIKRELPEGPGPGPPGGAPPKFRRVTTRSAAAESERYDVGRLRKEIEENPEMAQQIIDNPAVPDQVSSPRHFRKANHP